MSTANLARLAGVARDLRLDAEATLARRRDALDTARAQLEQLRRYARGYRAECDDAAVPRSAVDLQRRHAMIARLDDQVETLSTTAGQLERELVGAQAEQYRLRAGEEALEGLRARAALTERATGLRRELDRLDAACASRAATDPAARAVPDTAGTRVPGRT